MLKAKQQTELLIKLHPKDTPEEYERILSEYPNLHSRIIRNELSPVECIQVSDEVYGMTSIMLIEAYILGKKTVSLQPGLMGEDSCVLSRYDIIPAIISKNSTESTQPALFMNNDFEFEFEFQKSRFMEFLDSLILHIRNQE